jgi:peptidoglycan DL-endopeptidase CwlO
LSACACAAISIVLTVTVTASPASARAAPPIDHSVAAAAADTATSLRTLQALVVSGAAATVGTVMAAGLPQEDSPDRVAYAEVVRVADADYGSKRLRLAQAVAVRTGVDASLFDDAWARTDPRRAAAVYTGLAQLGTPYRYGGTRPGGFDCSGFTGYAWSAAGVELPRNSYAQRRSAATRSAAALQPGDLVFRPGHVMMYIGVADLMVHSPQTGRTVTIAKWGRVSAFGSPLRDG